MIDSLDSLTTEGETLLILSTEYNLRYNRPNSQHYMGVAQLDRTLRTYAYMRRAARIKAPLCNNRNQTEPSNQYLQRIAP